MERAKIAKDLVIWVDGEDGTRGGSIYLERAHRHLRRVGHRSILVRVEKGIKGLKQRIRITYLSWTKRIEVRGTLPREVWLLTMCRSSRGYVQSPVEEWSRASKVALLFYIRLRLGLVSCVSKTTWASLSQNIMGAKACVEYAQIEDAESARRCINGNSKRIVLVAMDSCNIDKGHLGHLMVATRLKEAFELRIEVFGNTQKSGFERIATTTYNGYVRNPFKKIMESSHGDLVFYLANSRFEGLHMAVVEAGEFGIPSLMSDIPAHRELENICGRSLLIEKSPQRLADWTKNVIEENGYCIYSDNSRLLYERFQERKAIRLREA